MQCKSYPWNYASISQQNVKNPRTLIDPHEWKLLHSYKVQIKVKNMKS